MAAQRKLSGTSFAARRRHGKRAAVLACALERGERLRGGASRQTVRGSAERASRAQATCGRRPWLGARARGRGRGMGGSGSMKRLRERSELACERDKDGMGGDSGAATRGSDVESGNGETTTFDGVSRGGAPGARGTLVQRQRGGRDGGFGQSSTRGRLVAAPAYGVGTASPRRERKQRRERWSEGNLVIKLKFKNSSL